MGKEFELDDDREPTWFEIVVTIMWTIVVFVVGTPILLAVNFYRRIVGSLQGSATRTDQSEEVHQGDA